MHLLAINWAEIGVKAAQLILSFSILVVLHELGHFLPARWFGCRVEKFYLFFNPWFSLYKKKIGETEYGLGWIPFGGYVKISGMIDESMDTEQMKQPAQPWEFRSKPAWQRLIIMLGGVTVNVLLALVIFTGIAYKWGDTYLPPQNLHYGIAADSLAQSMGLRDGDIITHVGGKPVEDELQVPGLIVTKEATQVTVLRDGQPVVLPVPEGMISSLNSAKRASFIGIRHLAIVDTFTENSNAYKAGIREHDTVTSVDGKPITYFHEFRRIVSERAGKTVQVGVKRAGQNLVIPVPVAAIDGRGAIGVFPPPLDSMGFEIKTRHYTFAQSVPAGLHRAKNTLSMYTTGIKQLFTGKANPNDSLGSIFSFGKIFPGQWDWKSFWSLTALFSIILAFMNVLPIPGLDGGHALFTLYEMITGRKPGDKFMEYAQIVGFVLLISLMIYALGLDVWRMFK
ncbi:RIP metalloprotease RseP [Flaviaesturariibacter aridisoli]|uniref:Zinc metalloprotease n=1 Tax=Flaviaesturariibacter aridisoli TaxID=2545761 RepID=A0A4R4DYG5_9BACT|nr:RIP metalloprotease RseP [Flaviaesturariibacter aridisoli]TCZ68326.1 RIP metalloprotease RseP [Flaviaesturariibacter aridisoli]